jgi:NADH:ubiquinone oxidoreductase subunit 6 (subunit J)
MSLDLPSDAGEALKSNQLASASGGIMDLLNMGLNAYSTVSEIKNANRAASASLNRNSAETAALQAAAIQAANPSFFQKYQTPILIGGVVVVVALVAAFVLKK